jgi:hypothetical protein
MTMQRLRWTRVAGLVCALGAAALAGDPGATPAKDAVEVRLAAKAAAVVRFRQTEASSTEVKGVVDSVQDLTREYTVTVKAARQDGGLDVVLHLDRVQGKVTSHTGSADVDSLHPAAVPPDPSTKLAVSMATAAVGKGLDVSLDAHGAVVAVKGVRELLAAAVKGTQFGTFIDPAKEFSDAKCVEWVAALLPAAPREAHASGVEWKGDLRERVGDQTLDFVATSKIASATEREIAVAVTLAVRPGAEEDEDGATVTGGGETSATFSTADGLVVKATKTLHTNREAGPVKSASRTNISIERLEAAAPAKAGDGKKPGGK